MKPLLFLPLLALFGCETAAPDCLIRATIATKALQSQGVKAKTLFVYYKNKRAGHCYTVWEDHGKMWAYDADQYGRTSGPLSWDAAALGRRLDGDRVSRAVWQEDLKP